MKRFILPICLSALIASSFGQSFDFSKCAQPPQCNPFYWNSGVCGSYNWSAPFGSANFTTFPKRVNGANVSTKTVLFQSLYSAGGGYSEAISLHKMVYPNRAYIFKVVATGRDGVSYQNYIPKLRMSMDIGYPNVNDSCNLGYYSFPSNSFIVDDYWPSPLDPNFDFQESLYTDSRYIEPNAIYSSVSIRALPMSGVPTIGFLLHKFEVRELAFSLTKDYSELYCSAQGIVTLNLQNPDGIQSNNYHWNLGQNYSGWEYQGAAAPQTITTTANTLQLRWVGTSAPSAISVVPYRNSIAYDYSYSTSFNFHTELPPNIGVSGPSVVNSTNATSYTNTYTADNVAAGLGFAWLVSPSNLGSYVENGKTLTYTPNETASGTVHIQAFVSNQCNSFTIYDKVVEVKNACDYDPVDPPNNLIATATYNGNATLAWGSRAPGSYALQVQLSDGTNFTSTSGTNSYNLYYGNYAVTGQFRVRVISCSSGHQSDWGAWQSFSLPAPPPQSTNCTTSLTNWSGTGSQQQVNLSWTPISSAQSYEARLDACCGSTYTGNTMTYSNLTGSSATVIAPYGNGTNYYAYIRPVCSGTPGAWSAQTSPVTGVYRPGNGGTVLTPVVTAPIVKVGDANDPSQSNLKVSPNPFYSLTNVLYTASKASDCRIEVYDLVGKRVMSKTFRSRAGQNNVVLDLSALSKGVYNITVIEDKTRSTVSKIIKM